jgi:hypothetical protein
MEEVDPGSETMEYGWGRKVVFFPNNQRNSLVKSLTVHLFRIYTGGILWLNHGVDFSRYSKPKGLLYYQRNA